MPTFCCSSTAAELFDSSSASRSVSASSSPAFSSFGIQTPSGAAIATCFRPLTIDTGDIPCSSATE